MVAELVELGGGPSGDVDSSAFLIHHRDAIAAGGNQLHIVAE